METLLLWTVALIAAAIVIAITLLGVSTVARRYRQQRFERQKKACERLLAGMLSETSQRTTAAILELKNSFPQETIEQILNKYLLERGSSDKSLAEIYEATGILDRYIRQFQEGERWTDRALAAQKLGEMGHPNAVIPLITAISNPAEEDAVKNEAMFSLGRIRDPRAIPYLIQGLSSNNPTAAQPIANALLSYGEDAVAGLCECLNKSTDENQRFWSARALGLIGSAAAVPMLAIALRDHSDRVREAAAGALGNVKAVLAVADLRIALLRDPVLRVRERAAEALGLIADESAISALGQALIELDETTKHRAMEALAAMGPNAAPIFFETLERGDAHSRALAASGLEKIQAAAALIESLSNETIRARALNILLIMAKSGVVETLCRSLKHPDAEIRFEICRILREARQPRSFDALIETAMTDADAEVRFLAVEALVTLGEEKALPVILRSLKEKTKERAGIIKALIHFSSQSLMSILPEIMPLAKDHDECVRQAAVNLLGFIPAVQAADILVAALKDSSPDVRKEAALALGRRRGEPDDSVARGICQALLDAVNDPSPDVRSMAVRSLGNFAWPEILAPLVRAFEKADETYRDDIADALSKIETDVIIKALPSLPIKETKTKAGIAWTLGLIGDERGYATLVGFLQDKEPLVRAAAAGALGNFRSENTAKLLKDFLADPNERVRAAVVNAIGKSNDTESLPLIADHLDDPDLFVSQRTALMLGALAGLLPAEDRARHKKSLRAWFEMKREDESSRTAGLLGLALMEDKGVFRDALGALYDQKLGPLCRRMLQSLPFDIRRRFFTAVSLDMQVYLASHGDRRKIADHYAELLLSSRRPEDRLRALEALLLLKDERAPALVENTLQGDPSADVRAQALKTISELLPGSMVLEKLARAVRDPSDLVRRRAIAQLQELNPRELGESRQVLLPLLNNPNDWVREAAAELAGRFFEDKAQELSALVNEQTPKYQLLGLLSALGRIGHKESASLFLNFLRAQDAEVRSTAARWAAHNGFLAKKELFSYLDDPQENVRIAVIQGLGRQLDGSMMEALAAKTEDPSPAVRLEVARILGKKRLADDARPAQILGRLLRDQHVEVRIQSLLSLWRHGVADIAQEAAETMAGLAQMDRQAFIERVEKDGFILELQGVLKNDLSPEKRIDALKILAALDGRKYLKNLLDALNDPAGQVRLEAVRLLGDIQDPAVKNALAALANDPTEAVRTAIRWLNLKIE
ncbi:MAG: HEAT repeat domain-containing protein [Elusimicrobia bacterium]|nr:HEAT repeat domain-containing protein [Elusimicrobiota bacterium]